MNHARTETDSSAPSRRRLLRTAAAGGAALAATTLPAGTAQAAQKGLTGRRRHGRSPIIAKAQGDAPQIESAKSSRATTELLEGFFAAKSARNPSAAMSFFSRRSTTYIDSTVGWSFPSWQALHDLFAQYMPGWPAQGASYMTRVVGGDTGAIVFFANAPGTFGANELRVAGIVDIRRGSIHRWIDYWDGRHFGTDATNALRLPADQWPSDFGEPAVGEQAHPAMTRASHALVSALRTHDADALDGLLAVDVRFEDLPSHVLVTGRRSTVAYLTGPNASLPYAAHNLSVRHVVGSAVGGGYEWLAPGHQVDHGLVALELDDSGAITRLTSVWDGSRVTAGALSALAAQAIEG